MKKGNLRIDNFAESTEGILKLTLRDVPRQASHKYPVLFSPSHIDHRISENSSCRTKTRVIWEIEEQCHTKIDEKEGASRRTIATKNLEKMVRVERRNYLVRAVRVKYSLIE